MAVPVGHSMAGYFLGEAVPARLFDRWWKLFLFAAVVANLPDIDFLPGMLTGDPNDYHRGPTHSLLAAAVVATPVALWFRYAQGRAAAPFVITFVIYSSHLVLDAIGPAAGGGEVRALWPFSDAGFSADVPLPARLWDWMTIERGPGRRRFVDAIVGRETIRAFAAELLVYGPLLAGGWALRWFWGKALGRQAQAGRGGWRR